MASSLQGKPESHLRLVSDEDALALPESAPPTDDSPTVISKTKPITPSGSSQEKITELTRQQATSESIVAGLRGRKLAHFELIEPIGVGGMAAVIRARDTQLDRFVALKILPPDMAKEPDNIHRFHQEARAAAKLDHENIARVFYCGEDQGLYFIAFEFVEGMNLRTILEQRGRLPVAESVRYILQIATGLEHAASRGVVHRDVKPSNIIITPTGRAKLVDMGLARNLERSGERDLTQSGVTLGTFDYLSPEQALEPREADARSDIYSLGCTFYHMLTGRPPAPDGTPAKKMHHHQHLAALDPREIDPTIPDEIVAILGRMMAKNPKDRYQRPIHLVQHLMQVAQKVGVADDLPEGGLFVDAPLPTPPGSRPVLIVGLALVALLVVTMMVSFGPEQYPKPLPPGDTPKKTNVAKVEPTPPKPGEPVPPRDDEVKSLADLNKALEDPAKSITAAINAPTIELDGLHFKGAKDQRLELSSDDAETNVLKFAYQKASAPVGLVLEGGDEVVFKKIKFEITSGNSKHDVAMIAVRGAKTVKFVQCVFPQIVPKTSPSYVPVASVLIEGGDENARPNVSFTECLFDSPSKDGGQAAIAINGPANVVLTDCEFKPHAMFFQFRDKCTRENTSLKLERCTGFVVQGPAFRFTAKAGARLRVDGSVFSRPTYYVPDFAPSPGLISFAGNDSVRFDGRNNIYHHLNTLIDRKQTGFTISPDQRGEFEKYLEKNDGTDYGSLHFPELAATPLAHAKPLEDSGPLIFQLKPEYHDKYGVRTTWTGEKMPLAVIVAKKEPPIVPKRKIVDASDPGAFKNLAEALARADDRDVIFIKHPATDGPHFIEVPPVTLKPGSSITLKPFEGCTPILKLDQVFTKKDSALFTLDGGKLQIEQMQILLQPTNAGQDSLSAVHLGESAQCVFKNCIFSLRTTTNVQLSVVTFVDLAQMMKLETPPAYPARVEFHECFIRGKGDLVALRGCRLLDVEMKNSLVALDGSLLDIEAASKAMPMSQGVRWKMDRSSIFATESLFAFRSKTGKVLTETDAKISRCLLVSLDPDQPVVLLDKAIPGDLTKYLKWTGDENYYANFSDQRRYKEDFTEQKSEVGKLTLPKLDDDNRRTFLWDAVPEWFVPAESEVPAVADFGMPMDARNRLMPAPPDPDE